MLNETLKKKPLMFNSSGMRSDETSEKVYYKPQALRYYILILFLITTMFNGLVWISLSPLTKLMMQEYHFSDTVIDLITLLYFILFTPGVIISMMVYNKYNLRAGLVIGTVMQTVGAIIKCFINTSFIFVLLGQSLWALAQPFIILWPALVATIWFEDSKRMLVITLGSNFYIIGVAIGFIIPTLFCIWY